MRSSTANAIFQVQKNQYGYGWVINAVWSDAQTEELLGVYETPEHAERWIGSPAAIAFRAEREMCLSGST